MTTAGQAIRRAALALVLGCLLLAAPASAAPTVRTGGTLIVGTFEPRDLNVVARRAAVTIWLAGKILLGAYTVDPRGRHIPSLIAGEPRLGSRPFSVTYTIDPRARWNDGVPVSARDFVFTWQAGADPKADPDAGQRARYQQIVRARILGPKRVKFVFARPYEAWKELFEFVLPWHALRGQDLTSVWRETIDDPRTGAPISDGPFVFQSWSRGSQLTLVRNERYWRPKAHLSRLVFRFLPDAAAELAALRAHRVDLIAPLPDQLMVSDLQPAPGRRVASGPGTIWDHIAFNLGPRGDPLLRAPFVRKAIADGIDRAALVALLSKTLLPGLRLMQSAVLMPFAADYEPHWQLWKHRPRAAVALLRSHGCRRGADGIFSCGGRRLSFRFVSTSGNQLREVAFARIEAQLRAVGIELQKVFEPPPLAFRRLEQTGDWDLFMFGWSMTVDPTEADAAIFGCHGALNHYGYCDARVTRLLGRALSAFRPVRRAALLNRADALMAADLPFLPLYVKPGYALYNAKIRNVIWNPDGDRFIFWNAEDWWIAGS